MTGNRPYIPVPTIVADPPRVLLLERQRGVAISLAVALGRLLDPLADFYRRRYHVVIIPLAVDLKFAECNQLGFHLVPQIAVGFDDLHRNLAGVWRGQAPLLGDDPLQGGEVFYRLVRTRMP